MSELAVGYVSIVPKIADGFKDTIAKEIGTAGEASGKTSGGGFKAAFTRGLAGIGGAVVPAIAGTLTNAFGGGFDRLMNIDQAKIKLRTLGIDTGAAMASVSGAVEGTKFALSDAVDMAAQLGAAGVGTGADMTRWLSLTADAAQFANVGFSDMQGMMQKIVADGKISGDTFQQLPLAAAALADYLGLSQAEVRELASAGEISAEQFAAAMESKIGGAAKNAGDSFLSIQENLKSALNATMAAVIEPFTKALTPILGAGLDLLRQFRDGIAKPIGESLSGIIQPKAEALALSISGIGPVFSGIKAAAGDVLSPLGAGLEHISGLAEAFAVGFTGNFGAVEGIVGTVASAVPLLTGPLGILKAVVMEILGSLSAGDVAAFAGSLGTMLVPIVSAVGELSTALTGGLSTALAALIPPFAAVVAVVAELAGTFISQLVPVITDTIATALPALILLFAALTDAFGAVLAAVGPVLTTLIDLLAPILEKFIAEVMPPFAAMIAVAAAAFSELAGIVVTEILPVLVAVVEFIAAHIGPVLEWLAGRVAGTVQFISDILTAAMTIISGVITLAMGILTEDWGRIWEGIKTIFSGAWEAIKGVLDAALRNMGINIEGGVDGVIATIAGLPARALAALGDLGSYLKASGAALVDGFKNGIIDAFTRVTGAVRAGLGKIRDLFPFSPAKEGPFSGSGYVTFSGKALGRDFGDSLAAQSEYVKTQAASLLAAAKFDALDGQVSGFGGLGSGTAARSGLGWEFPTHVTLKAEDGTMLGVFRAVAEDRIDARLAPAGRAALADRLGR